MKKLKPSPDAEFSMHLAQILRALVVEQATRELSGTTWAQTMLRKIDLAIAAWNRRVRRGK